MSIRKTLKNLNVTLFLIALIILEIILVIVFFNIRQSEAADQQEQETFSSGITYEYWFQEPEDPPVLTDDHAEVIEDKEINFAEQYQKN